MMSSAYFTAADHAALAEYPHGAGQPVSEAIQIVHDKLYELHISLHRRMRDQNWDLHPHWDRQHLIVPRSAALNAATQDATMRGLTLSYLRSKEHAQLVERLTGREGAGSHLTLDSNRHPVIEVRVTPENLVVELVLSPSAWWDQRNLIGKVSVARHRETLRGLLQRMNGDFFFGFWEGVTLSEQHLTNRQLLRGNVFDEWMSTFADGQDWLRVGVWYVPEEEHLRTERIVSELVTRIGALYNLYNFTLWTSNNNFQTFYRGHGSARMSSGREF
ncbi:hypothetical protein FBR02_07110 [Anaerolineae bacterium CFX9]|nr:hypothetical protein [Anaerolineae bacterium CFX9]